MIIRPARMSDAATIAGLATQLGYPTRPEEAEPRLRDVTSRPENAILVAESDGAVVGWIHVAASHHVETECFAGILALVVDQEHRSGGIGAELVEAAAEWGAKNGFATLRVRSNVVRERTHTFYERLGFARIKSQVVFARPIAK
ncbi:MAG TPA: GNAT family N-acetyltransferase [Thermoanaerobaculia bacterium]|jgi:GNAT superfamily N-acetyltransferase